MINAVEFISVIYWVIPWIAIPLNGLCLLISTKFVPPKFGFVKPITNLMFGNTIIVALLLFLCKPVKVIQKGTIIVGLMNTQGDSYIYFYFALQIAETYMLFSTLITYVVITVRYLKIVPTLKVIILTSIIFAPFIILMCFHFSSDLKEWIDSSVEYHKSIEEIASEMTHMDLQNITLFVEEVEHHKSAYIIDMIFVITMMALYIGSVIAVFVIERCLPHETVVAAKIVFSTELRRSTRSSIAALLILVALPRCVINMVFLANPDITTIQFIPFYLGDCLMTLVIPLIFLSGFYFKHLGNIGCSCCSFCCVLESTVSPSPTEEFSRYV